jgi:hypothetical protein
VIESPNKLTGAKTLKIEAAWKDEGMGKNDSNGSDALGILVF